LNTHTIHEREVKAVSLPGRDHKMIISPTHFGVAKHLCFGVADFPPLRQAPAHVHETSEEVIYILTGKGEIYFDGKPEPVEPGTCVYIPPGVVHSINNLSDEILKVAYVFSPPVVQGSYDPK
jgi:mannose-6-phosphate isomerase-like protein (cupin superfamily)